MFPERGDENVQPSFSHNKSFELPLVRREDGSRRIIRFILGLLVACLGAFFILCASAMPQGAELHMGHYFADMYAAARRDPGVLITLMLGVIGFLAGSALMVWGVVIAPVVRSVSRLIDIAENALEAAGITLPLLGRKDGIRPNRSDIQ
jgi:hypothetical protein